MSFSGCRLIFDKLIISLAFISFLFLAPTIVFAGDQVAVKGAYVNLRSGPSTANGIVGSALQGEKLDLLSSQGGWYRVKKGTMTCWVAGWLVTPTSGSGQQASSGAGQAVVKGTYINLREAPNTGSRILGKAFRGESLQVLSGQGGWYRVKKGTMTCWVAGWLVDIKKDAPQPEAPANNTVSATDTTSYYAISGYTAEVTGELVNIRKGPGTGYDIMGQASRGSSYDLQGRSGDWLKISTGGNSGWIYGQLASVAKAPAARTPSNAAGVEGSSVAFVSGPDVSIMSGPGTGYDVVSRAGQGDRVVLLDRANDWYRVQLDNGGVGWIVATMVEDGGTQADNGTNAGKIVPSQPDSSGGSSINNSSSGSVSPSQPNSSSGAVVPSQQGNIKKIYAKSAGGNTTVTIDSDGKPIKFSVTSLSNPDRLAVDIEGMGPGQVPDNIYLNSQLVNSIRVGVFSKSPLVTRVVIDLKSKVSFDNSLSGDGSELQILISPWKAKSLAGSKIVLDPGHGGSDPGATGPTGLMEKNVTLDIALKAAQILRSQGATVLLTRTDDTYVDLYERPEMANNNNATLFVSIHCNANTDRSIGGTSTYYVRTPDAGLEGVRDESIHLAQCVQNSLLAGLHRQDRGVLKANYVVLTKTKMPATLAEVAFISNTEEERLLGDDTFCLKVASAIAQGIANYFK